MQKGKRSWKSICVIIAVMLLYCMSALVSMAEEGEVIFKRDTVEFDIGTSYEDGQVRLYTYTIKEADGTIAGTVEIRYGINTSPQGRLFWITIGQDTFQFDGVNLRNDRLQIVKNQWDEFFTKEAYTYEMTETILEPIQSTGIKEIRWGEKGTVYVDWAKDKDFQDRVYVQQMYCEDRVVYTWTIRRSKEEEWTQVRLLSASINESGTYRASIKVVGTSRTLGDSEEIFAKTSYQYDLPDTNPDAQVPKIKEIRCKSKDGEVIPSIMEWDCPDPRVDKYDVHVEAWIDGKSERGFGWRNLQIASENGIVQYDWSTHGGWSQIMSYASQENVRFVARVRPISFDIDVLANGEETRDEDYKFYDKVGEVTETLKSATADSVLKDVEEAGIGSVAVAMQTDENVLNKMEDIEKEYKENNKIETNLEIQHSKISDVKVVGAAMNATSGAITLHFNEVPNEERKEINRTLYENDIQVEIKLDGMVNEEVKKSGVLLSPITVTMNPPKGVDLSKLVILHYHSDGEPERIYPAFRADGKITFSVTKFSTFVFAEVVSYTEDTNPSQPSEPSKPSKPSQKPEDDDDDDDDDSSSSSYSGITFVSAQGIQNYGTGKRFVKTNGSVAKSEWINKDGKWYYAGADGMLKTGWYQNEAGAWYYLQSNCEMATNWQFVNGKWYYLDSKNGDMKTSWLKTSDGKWYYLNPKNGDMAEGWQLVSGKWYYLNPKSGEMATGWKQIGGKWYFLSKNGDCLMNTITPDGYQVDKDGAWIP